ncbi:MAG TPA: BamA/TamA family outer membrane protein [Kofleriaceae bacterium]|nr:BamA/TamA family outer membrane protein [Kofleriaceae bacterium]
MDRRSFWPLAVLAVAGCHHSVHKPGEETLKAIQFEGNAKISDAALREGLALHRTLQAKQAPDPYQIETDTKRLRNQYVRAGYFDADVQVRVERDQDATTVIYTIEEGQPVTTHVRISGLPDDPDLTVAEVRAKLPIAEGAPFDYDVYDRAKVNLLGVVQDAGYARATLDASVTGDPATHTALVELRFTPGPKCTFGTVAVQGAQGDLRDAVLARLHFAPGDTYSTRAVTRTQREIYGMARFSTVQVHPDPGDAPIVNMKVAVAESAAHQVTLGGGFGIDPLGYEVRGRAGYQVTGWPMPLNTVTLELRPAYVVLRKGGNEPRLRALARLERQDLFRTYARGTVEARYNYLAYEAYTEYGPAAQVGYEAPLGSRHIVGRVGYMVHRYDFRDPNPLITAALQHQIGIDHPELVGGYQQSIIGDFRDHPVEPTLGVYGELHVTEGTRYAGGDYTFQEVVPELRGYVPAGPVVLAARARYGAIRGEVPPTERFYAGGATSQRGFSERELSPFAADLVKGSMTTVPYGGAGLIDSSIEARFPITWIRKMLLGGVVFLDGGDVTERAADLDVMHLHWAAGIGLRLHTLVGPVRADVGYRLNRTGDHHPEPGSRYAFHLSLGEAF